MKLNKFNYLYSKPLGNHTLTRMHSSRMRTTRALTDRIMVFRGGVWHVCPLPRTPPLWTEFLTHASENITLPQLRCGR